ncbi:MAG: hypothetical protein HY360_11210 [Verrucomicrobia bacterium]|nr:hypothetical protein [Verrucomicrobiota bacterium]
MKSTIKYLLLAGSMVAQSRLVAIDPIPVGANTCLFLDDHFIAEQAGVQQTWHQGKPRAETAIEESPWENWPIMEGNCFYDPERKIYRMYYQTTLSPTGEKGIAFRADLCYAESKDARTWVKPKLGLVDFNGSKDNNIVISYAGPPCVFIDPLATDPAGRLKLCTYFLKAQPISNNQTEHICLQSEDGIHWTYVGAIQKPGFENPDEGRFNDLFIIMWDALRQCYLGNFRTFSTHAIGEIESVDGAKKNRRRAIGITTSDQLTQGWTPVRNILKPDDLDDQRSAKLSKDPNKPEWAEMYVMPMFAYGNHYLGFVTFYDVVDSRDNNGGGDLQLAYSNDGQKWRRPPERMTAMEHTKDRPELVPTFAQHDPPLDMGNEIWVFYSENNGTHGIFPFEKSDGRIRAAVWRKDGFVSVDCADKGGLTTKPLRFKGKELRVNFNTQEGGYVRVAILDEQGQPVQGLNLAECEPLKGDDVARPVRWMRGDLASVQGKSIRLRFELAKCQLWSFRFAE